MKSILPYVAKRLLYFVPTLLALTLMIHLVLHYSGADPVRIMLGDAATPDTVAVWTHRLGMDEPVYVQYWNWLVRLLHGDMGVSLILAQGFSASDLIRQRLPVTGFIALLSMILACVIGIGAGSISALRRWHLEDYAVTSFAVAGISLPDFWLGFMLVICFSLRLHLFPTMGYVRFFGDPWASLHHVVLPCLAIAAPLAAVITRMVRTSLLETVSKDFVTVAKAYGLPPRVIVVSYIWRNSLIPIITIIGLHVRYLLGGVVVIEKVFSLPGLGSLLADAAFSRDIFLVQDIVVVFLLIILIGNLVVDVSYTLIDPRVTF
jgi:peptide/nickel transport system permease protein